MKTIATLFVLFGLTLSSVVVDANPVMPRYIRSLAPTTPKFAPFEEFVPETLSVSDFRYLAPVLPALAGFEDLSDDTALIRKLAPALPAEAGYEDSL